MAPAVDIAQPAVMRALGPGLGALDVLCLGAHPDDIEIGCGGTLLTLADRPRTTVHALVLTGDERRAAETRAALPCFFPGATLDVLGLPDGRLPGEWAAVKEALEGLAVVRRPDVVLAPRPDDAHQDHRLLGELVTTVWRDSLVLHYEIPKWDGDLAQPTHYVPFPTETARRKVELLDKCFPSQAGRDWWDDELFRGLMRMRGMECRARYAEGFFAAKVVLDLGGGDRRSHDPGRSNHPGPVAAPFARSTAAQQRLHDLVPGGAHTYARGADQYPEGMAPVLARGRRRTRRRRGRQLVRRVRHGAAVGHARARLRARRPSGRRRVPSRRG